MGSKVSIEKAKEMLFSMHGDTVNILEYSGMSKEAVFSCCNNHIWSARASSVISDGNGCSICGKRKKYDFNYVKEYIEENNCEVLSYDYVNVFTPLSIKLECGHVRNISFNNFRKGRRCRICSWKRMGEDKRTEIDEIKNFLISNNFEMIEFEEYKSQRETKVSFVCPSGHITRKSVADLFRNPTCKECSKIRMSKLFMGDNSPNWKGGKTDIREFMDDKLIKWKNESMKNSEYACVITGDRFDHIHHLYSFSSIVLDAVRELGFDENKRLISSFSSYELFLLTNKIVEIHYRYPLGVCLRDDVHRKFHSLYGSTKNTPEQFYDFIKKIEIGEIKIPR